jgi:hypothetical protein
LAKAGVGTGTMSGSAVAPAGTVGSSAGMNAANTTFPNALGSSTNAGNFGFTATQAPELAPTSMFGTSTQANAGNLGGMQSYNPADFATNPSVVGSQVDGPTFNTLASNTLNDTSKLGGMGQLNAAPKTFGDNLQQAYGNVAADPMKFMKQNAMGLGLPVVGGIMAGLEPSDIYGKQMDMSDEEAYDPYATQSFNFDSGLRLYADGGTVTGGGLADLYSGSDNVNQPNLSQDGYGLGRLNNLAAQQSNEHARVLGYAEGGEARYTMDSNSLGGKMFGSTGLVDQLPPEALDEILGNPGMRQFMGFRAVEEPTYYSPSSGSQRGGLNLNDDTGYRMAKGGYLDGPGDGMSDSIPATIEGKQPARLADGEFVIPADVVSHLGNGSTKAGSQRLYGMLDKVRKARTGTKKQGKQINPAKYMPA